MRRNAQTAILTREDLDALIDHLNRHLAHDGCDQTLRVSRAFLASRGLNFAQAVRWLEAQGAYCDCEVLMNVS